MTNSEDAPPRRLLFIDVLRLIAAVQMIQGHTVSALLAPLYRAGPGFQCWTFARGLTSVMFLFSAGFALAQAEARAHHDAARRRRARRALRLWLLGYALHAPLALLFGADLATSLRAWAAVDVLQCIAVSLLSLELLCHVATRRSARVLSALLLAVLAIAAAPLTRSLVLSDETRALGNYLTSSGGSLFPLLPWAGYLLVGFALGTRALARPTHIVADLWRAGGLTLGAGLLVQHASPTLPHAVSPGYALVKLGCVCLLSGLLALLLRPVERLPGWLSTLASETLFLYVSHVLILYADHVGLASLLGAVHTPLDAALLALALLLVCSVAALLLRSLRSRRAGGTRAASFP